MFTSKHRLVIGVISKSEKKKKKKIIEENEEEENNLWPLQSIYIEKEESEEAENRHRKSIIEIFSGRKISNRNLYRNIIKIMKSREEKAKKMKNREEIINRQKTRKSMAIIRKWNVEENPSASTLRRNRSYIGIIKKSAFIGKENEKWPANSSSLRKAEEKRRNNRNRNISSSWNGHRNSKPCTVIRK